MSLKRPFIAIFYILLVIFMVFLCFMLDILINKSYNSLDKDNNAQKKPLIKGVYRICLIVVKGHILI